MRRGGGLFRGRMNADFAQCVLYPWSSAKIRVRQFFLQQVRHAR